MALDETSILGCGHSIDEVWANIDHPPTAHETSCTLCGAARQSLQSLRAATAGYQDLEAHDAGPETDEALRPRPRVRENILAVARAEVRRGRRIPIAATALGPVMLSEQALVSLIRGAADSVAGVRARRISLTAPIVAEPGHRTGTDADPDGGAPAVVLEQVTCRIAVSHTVSAPRVADTVRDHVIVALSRHVAIDPKAVNIVVEDLYDA